MASKGLGWMIIDSLDTLIIMNLTSRVLKSHEWIANTLDFEQDQEVNTFETTIRMLGGLLSARYLTMQTKGHLSDGEEIYLQKAVDLADRLLGAFDSPSGVPYASVNLQTRKGIPSHAGVGSSSTSEAGSVQLEMKYLALLTNQPKYWQKAEKVIQVMDDDRMKDGLLPVFVHPDYGRFLPVEISLGSRGDSYYGMSML